MILTNNEIYTYTRQLMDAFQDGEQKLPIKINFYLQKNKNTLLALAQDIERSRLEIAQNFGELDETGTQYQIPAEKLAEASKELEDLFSLEQDVAIAKISVDSLSNDLTLTTAQMEAIMFMID
jgi:predicted  nucleic acid-binding Zn-ribbon protein